MAKKIVLAGACRTAIGSMGGALSTTPAPELGSIVIKEALNRAGVAPEQVDHVYMGCVIQAGLGQNVARQASLKAGLPVETPAVTVNVVCGSGLNCVNMAAQMIQAGDADIVVAGGMENMSMAPYALKNARYGYRMGNAPMIDTMVNDALWDAFNDYHMGITAENVAEQWHLTREELDAFAAESQQKCEQAQAAGVPIISAMGAGNKLDGSRFRISDISETRVCPLARVMRRELKKRGVRRLKVVWSDEQPTRPLEDMANSCRYHCICPPGAAHKCTDRRNIPGSTAFVPPIVGLLMAGEVIKDLTASVRQEGTWN